jgi:flagellar hook-associated protein 1 FlgK
MVATNDPLTATGTFRIAALDADGNLTATDSWADISLPTAPATVQGMIDAINGSTAGTYLTASLVDGRMVIEGLDGSRISINEMTSSITTSDGRSQGMSHYFGLNDFVATVKRSDTMTSSAQDSATAALGVTASSMVISAGSGVLTTPGITVNYTANDSLTDVRDSIRTALQGAGMTAADAAETAYLVEDGDRYRLVISYTSNMTITDSGNMSKTIGMTEDMPVLAGNMDVASSIKNDPARIVRGQLNADTYETSTAVVDTATAIPGLGPLVPPPVNYTLTVAGDFTSVNINYDSNSSLEDIANAINNSATLTDNNINAQVVFDSALGGYKLRVTDADGDPFFFQDSGAGAGDSLTEILGLGIQHGVHEGDNSAALALSQTFERTDIDFESAGGLSAERTSLTDFAAGIIATAATKASVASSSYEFQSNLVTDLGNRIQNEAGVNLDEEMSDLIIFQRAYSASARVISTVDELFDTLLNAV